MPQVDPVLGHRLATGLRTCVQQRLIEMERLFEADAAAQTRDRAELAEIRQQCGAPADDPRSTVEVIKGIKCAVASLEATSNSTRDELARVLAERDKLAAQLRCPGPRLTRDPAPRPGRRSEIFFAQGIDARRGGSKWLVAMSEYWIVAVHYHPAGPIEQVQAMLFSAANNSLGPMQLISREVIVHWLTSGFATVFTAFTTGPNQWRKGAQVQLTTNGAFITTEPDGRTYNNLAHLPRY